MKGIKLVNKTTGHAWTMPLNGAEKVGLNYDVLTVSVAGAEVAIAIFQSLRWHVLDNTGSYSFNDAGYTDVEFIA